MSNRSQIGQGHSNSHDHPNGTLPAGHIPEFLLAQLTDPERFDLFAEGDQLGIIVTCPVCGRRRALDIQPRKRKDGSVVCWCLTCDTADVVKALGLAGEYEVRGHALYPRAAANSPPEPSMNDSAPTPLTDEDATRHA
jgi:hypothetical protein